MTKTASSLGGEDAVRSLLHTNFKLASVRFNSSGEFNETHFFMSDFGVFKGKSVDQITASSRDFTLVINQNIGDGDAADGYYGSEKVVHISSKTVGKDRLFSQQGVDYFLYTLGLALGAFDRSAGDVNLTSNPVAAQGQEATSSYLNSKSISSSWNNVSIQLIKEGSGYSNFVPSDIDMTVQTVSGEGLDSVAVKIYPVRWGSGRVMSNAMFEGATNTDGRIAISNPYLVPSDIKGSNEDHFANLFVSLQKGTVKNFFFIPLEDAVLDGLTDNDNTYSVIRELNFVTLADLRVAQFSFDDSTNIGANTAGINVTENIAHSTDAKLGSGAAEFSGAQHFVLGREGSINADSAYTVAFWFKTKNFTADAQNVFWTMSTFSGSLADDPWKPGGLTFRFRDNRWANYDVGWEGGSTTENPVVADGQWHHLTTTVKYIEGTTGADIKMYVDGLLVVSGTHDINDPHWSDETPDLTSFVVKIGYGSTAGDAGTPFNGFIDDLQIFKSALDDNRVYEVFSENN